LVRSENSTRTAALPGVIAKLGPILAVAALMAGCGTSDAQKKADEEAAARGWDGGLVGTSWIARSIDGTPAFQNPMSMLIFQSATMLVGNAGCNTFSGTVGIAGAQLLVGPLATTERACVPAVMAQERSFLDALQNARGFQTSEEMLVLFGPSGQQTLEFARVPQPL